VRLQVTVPEGILSQPRRREEAVVKPGPLLLLAVSLAWPALPANADSSAQELRPEDLRAAQRQSEVVCTKESVLGSHASKRTVCRTRAQLDAERKAAQRDLQQAGRTYKVRTTERPY
jgi:hypothetical protein